MVSSMKRFQAGLCLTSMLCAACSGNVNGIRSAAPAAGPTRATTSGAVNWPVWGFDPGRSSYNSAERTLTTANVGKLQEQWKTSLGIQPADSAPILLLGSGPSSQTMLFTTTKKGSTLGIDAKSGQIIWTFTTSGGRSTTSAPAADPSGTAIYAPGLDGKVHKLNTSNGTEIQGGGFPLTISLLPQTELDESPLNVANGYLYATLGGAYDDHPPYDGHVVSVNLNTGATAVFNSLCSNDRDLLGASGCSQQHSGIWGRGGAVVDPDPSMNGRIYVATGNGDFNANAGGYNYGDSILALAPDLSSLLGSYTPPNYAKLAASDLDLGSTSPAILPEQTTSQTPWMLVQAGKDGNIRLINRATLPGVGGELQVLHPSQSLYSAPAVWTDSSNHVWIFFGFPARIYAYQLVTDASGVSKLSLKWSKAVGKTVRGTSPVVADGIVFGAFNGAIVALAATTGAELWSSATLGSQESIGPVHFESPIVVNGWVYCSDSSHNLTAYALPASLLRRGRAR